MPGYLEPYVRAAGKFGGGFGSLLWASPKTQAARFGAIARAADLHDRSLLDVGCGRADLLEYLLRQNIALRRYVGLEVIDELLFAARRKGLPNAEIVQGDFVRDSSLLDCGVDVLIFCGSLNTLDEATFYSILDAGVAAARQTLVFNFLCAATLAASPYLTWHRSEEVMSWAAKRSDRVRLWDDYLNGDATIAIGK